MVKQKKLRSLQPNDIVDLVAPGSACSKDELNKSIQVLKSWGLQPRLPKNIFSGHKILAHSDEQRFLQLKTAIESKDSKAVWCVRGGYGSLRLVDRLSKIKPPQQPKIFLGYSDITTLHSYMYKYWSWPTWHGPLFDRLGNGKLLSSEERQLKSLLFGKAHFVEYSSLKPMNIKAEELKSGRAPIIGGNMTVFASAIGTKAELKAKGHFVFFEDLGERPHRVDRMLTQMQQSGVFHGCRGVILGDFLSATKDKSLLWRDVFGRFAESAKFPIFKGLPVGHGKVQKTLPLGITAHLYKSNNQRVLKVPTGVE